MNKIYFKVVDTVSTTASRQENIGEVVKISGHIWTLRMNDGKEFPFHRSRLIPA